MFEAAVTKFAKAVGDNVLMPVPSLTDAASCDVFNVVVKKNRRWFWQSPKYVPSRFKLEDILRETNVCEHVAISSSTLMPSYEKTNKLSVNGKLGANLKGFIELEVGGSDSIDLETKFDTITRRDILSNDALDMIKEKHIDLQHQLFTETLQHPRKVLCIVVISISLGGPGSIRTQLEINADESFNKGSTTASEDLEVSGNSSRSMSLGTGTILAYSVYELKVDMSDGTFHVVLDPDNKGGFCGEDKVDCADSGLDDLEESYYETIVKLERSERASLREAVLGVCAFEQDVDTMLVLIKQACNYTATSFPCSMQDMGAKFKCDTKHWMYLLSFAGFSFDKSTCCSAKPPSARLASLRCLFEALIELEAEQLQYFVKLEQLLVNPLLCLLKNATDKKSQTMKDPTIRCLYESENPARELLRELGFSEGTDGTVGAPPGAGSCGPGAQGTMRAVYALWWEEDTAGDGNYCVIL